MPKSVTKVVDIRRDFVSKPDDSTSGSVAVCGSISPGLGAAGCFAHGAGIKPRTILWSGELYRSVRCPGTG